MTFFQVTNITETFPLPKGQTAEGLAAAVENSLGSFLEMGNYAISKCPIAARDPRTIDALRQSLRAVQDTGKF